MTTFREVLRPSAWMYLIAAFMIPTTILVLAPFSLTLGIILSIVVYVAIVIPMVTTSPVITVTETELRVGKAHISRELIGAVSAYSGDYAVAARGTQLDARAWIFLRGWINPVVRVDITDSHDPTPYWLFSSRKPEELVAALRAR
ncbi:hypothetical protein M2119_001273 [Aurantimicrobium minutum]|uniref:DUF3093 domain-containing protein n=1 Tax=Aurantimicrobium minutum TaxID=708131 RepID=UPI002473AF11|nr:DUF3093 domain-containing protein [Aurantimicrobium minutum]MDH6533036.1 hypothetical protein [Aurantimicrobium minutum]